MPRHRLEDAPLTPLELEIMNVLWTTGPANVQTVQAGLKGRELAYTTVQTMLNVLHRKGRVQRQLKDRAYLYRPILSRQKAVRQALEAAGCRVAYLPAYSPDLNPIELAFSKLKR